MNYKSDAEFGIISEFLDAKYLKKIKSFAHENSATVNDVLIAAYSLVLSEFFKEKPELIPMRMAVDLRYASKMPSAVDKLKFLGGDSSAMLSKMLICMNYSVPVWLPVKLTEVKTLKNILNEVTKSTKILKSESRGIGSASLIERENDVPSLFDTRQVLGGPFVSNAGIIDEKLLDFGDGTEIEELLPYIHFNSGSPFSLSVVTWKDKITLSSVDEIGSELSSGLLKKTKEILENPEKY